jgi:hypothetical protein
MIVPDLIKAVKAGQEKARLEIQGKHCMNERIKLLASKAGIYGAVDINGNFANEAEVKKFAELIVRECAGIAEKEQSYNDRHEIHVNIDQCILIEFGL